MSKINIIIDNDSGIDDSFAITLAAASSKINYICTISSWGNSNIEQDTFNDNCFLTANNLTDHTIYRGSATDILGNPPLTDGYFGKDNKCDIDLKTSKDIKIINDENLFKSWDEIQKHKDIQYVVLGPCTNLFKLIKIAGKKLWDHITQVIIMGGNLHSKGNTPGGGEYNFASDIPAVEQVLNACSPTLVTWDIAEKLAITKQEIQKWKTKSIHGNFFIKICKGFYDYKKHDLVHLCDGLCILDLLYDYKKTKINNLGLNLENGKLIENGGNYSITYVDKFDVSKMYKDLKEVLKID